MKVCSVAAGDWASCAVTAAGELFTWGGENFGQLGHGDRVDQLAQRCVEALQDGCVVAVSAGAEHTVAATRGCSVFGWGRARGLGLPDTASEDVDGFACVLSPFRYPELCCVCAPSPWPRRRVGLDGGPRPGAPLASRHAGWLLPIVRPRRRHVLRVRNRVASTTPPTPRPAAPQMSQGVRGAAAGSALRGAVGALPGEAAEAAVSRLDARGASLECLVAATVGARPCGGCARRRC